MGEYWKADALRKLIKLEKENNEDATITMKYLTYLKGNSKLIEGAHGFNKNNTERKELAEDIIKTIEKRKDRQHIGTLTRIYSYCKKQIREADVPRSSGVRK